MREICAEIVKLYLDICHQAQSMGLPTDGIKIHMHSKLKEAIGLNDFLEVKELKIPVIVDNTISDIYIYDPEWENWNERICRSQTMAAS